jgi:hypothetical protein
MPVIHVHGRDLFDSMLSSGAPRTAPDIAFGTPEMALAVIESTRNLIIETSQQARK